MSISFSWEGANRGLNLLFPGDPERFLDHESCCSAGNETNIKNEINTDLGFEMATSNDVLEANVNKALKRVNKSNEAGQS